MLAILNTVQNAQNALYDACDFRVEHFVPEPESEEYYAHSCCINNKNIKFRIAKKTPTKTGWFVTLWKRGNDRIIAPYDASDSVDFFVVTILDKTKLGQFIFPKSILLKKNVFSTNNKGGKRAIRVYTPWDEATSAQAIKTQKWQVQYFIDLTLMNAENIEKIKTLYSL